MTAPSPAQILGGLVHRARREKDMTVAEIAKTRSMSHVTWAKVERGEPVVGYSYAQVDAALDLHEGTCAAAADGAEGLRRFAEKMGWDRSAVDEAENAVRLNWTSRAVRSRAKQLGLDFPALLQVWRDADDSGRSLTDVECRLQWEPGSLVRIKDGLEPIPAKRPLGATVIGQATETDTAGAITPSKSTIAASPVDLNLTAQPATPRDSVPRDVHLSGTAAAASGTRGDLTVNRGRGSATAAAAHVSGHGTAGDVEQHALAAEAHAALVKLFNNERQKPAAQMNPHRLVKVAGLLTEMESLLSSLREEGLTGAVNLSAEANLSVGTSPGSEDAESGD